jgi:putative alpha-1,2-mannosidase
MKLTASILLVFLNGYLLVAQTKEPADYVNPFSGTGGNYENGFGNTFPGAAYPFGMIQLSPDNGGRS